MNPRIAFDQNFIGTKDFVLGIDEVGWGCVAGPVVLGGCLVERSFYENYQEIIKTHPLFEKVRDSKKLRETRRKEMFDFLSSYKDSLHFFVGLADVNYINSHKLAKAYTLAFDQILNQAKDVLRSSSLDLAHILIDGNRDPKSTLTKDYDLIIKGDDQSFAIALASLFSKEYRDNFMRELGENDPRYALYEFAKNKGYGTDLHTQLIRKYGLSDQHRIEASTKLITN